jgi:urease accessory protein
MHFHSWIVRRGMVSTRRASLLAAIVLTTAPALAHTSNGLGIGFVSGFTHPLTGVDHILAMVAVGIWGAQLGQPAIWLLPVTFPLVMSIGGALGVRGVPIPGVEIGVAVSAIVLGAMILSSARPPLWVAAAIVGAFAIFHGHAHGTELPKAAYPLAFGVGFVLSTGLLHLSGIAIGLIHRWPAGARALRMTGAGISVAGVFLLLALVRGA